MSSVALGELLTVAAVPVATVLIMIAAILSRRFRRTASVLAALGVVALISMLIGGRRLSAPLVEARALQAARFADLEIGFDQAQVEALMGPPDRRCEGPGDQEHEARATEILRQRLFKATTERWIYGLGGGAAQGGDCLPAYADGEIGFNADGRVLWYVELTGERFMTY